MEFGTKIVSKSGLHNFSEVKIDENGDKEGFNFFSQIEKSTFVRSKNLAKANGPIYYKSYSITS